MHEESLKLNPLSFSFLMGLIVPDLAMASKSSHVN